MHICFKTYFQRLYKHLDLRYFCTKKPTVIFKIKWQQKESYPFCTNS
jgi:hypothetical protein